MLDSFETIIRRTRIIFSNPHKKSNLQRYTLPIVSIILVICLKIILHTVLSEYSYHLLPVVIVIGAFYGGMGPGLLATGLVVFLDTFIFLLPGVSYFDVDNIISSLLLALSGIIISIISEAKTQADKQKDDFIGFASHELKNPLTTIQGYAQMLQKQSVTARRKVHSIGETIEEQTKRATYLINELLDITKIEAGKLSFHDEIFVIATLAEQIIHDQRLLYPTHRIILEAKTQKKVYADKYRITQVLINLISNAVKYSPNAKKVLVKIENKRKNVVISVQDFGSGIARKNLEKIFDPYFREGVTMQRGIQGLGLGLYISSQIVQKYQGKLWVKSTLQRGSTFFFSLPVL